MNNNPELTIDPAELETQVVHGHLFTHTALTTQAMRINENESFLYGLIDFLIEKGIVEPDGLKQAVNVVRQEQFTRRENLSLGVAIQVEADAQNSQSVQIDCQERLPVCKAVCCKLHFALTVEEIETGKIKWELGQPYYNRQHENGYCHKNNPADRCCDIYSERPTVCRNYNCAQDKRIWLDFEKQILNSKWINANLDRARRPQLMQFSI
ncbi:Putative zinc-or iron-chelating domain-containing protein [Nitrosomonas marina]|uniref:Putative zinc-or iron-chelating domain-containing protein n=1 Tax=Nitrosomonas marina TaxID=917 RepID=A0A1I0F1U9_9PROT|nr:YkgJ family cysteine cluster protein [Nitrosomonas marina]SET51966.1 Putative zinc-or iron-chelating domain-containing protein [Nitrosomonas marina]